MQSKERVQVFGFDLDRLTQAGAIDRILSWCAQDMCGQVVTINLDFLVKMRADMHFRTIVRDADLALADGMPLVWASHIAGAPLPERVTGADIIVPLCQAAARAGRSVFFMGATLETLAQAARTLFAQAPGLEIAGVYAPPFGFQPHGPNDELEDFIREVRPDIVFAALGAPKQDIWGRHVRDSLPVHAVLGIGAGLDFIAGAHARAPEFLQRAGLEWLYRLVKEPKRLARRYGACAVILPGLFVQEIILRLARSVSGRAGKSCAR